MSEKTKETEDVIERLKEREKENMKTKERRK